MLDISKLQKKEALAKEMVKLGAAIDLESAYNQIEDNDMVNSHDDFRVMEKKEEPKQVKIEPLNPAQIQSSGAVAMPGANDIDIIKRIDEIEKKINDLATFLDKYKTQNDNNLKEVDTTMKNLTMTVRDMKTNARIAASEASSPKHQEKKDEDDYQAVTKPKDDWDTSQFAVDKIFNNSHGQMMGKLK